FGARPRSEAARVAFAPAGDMSFKKKRRLSQLMIALSRSPRLSVMLFRLKSLAPSTRETMRRTSPDRAAAIIPRAGRRPVGCAGGGAGPPRQTAAVIPRHAVAAYGRTSATP